MASKELQRKARKHRIITKRHKRAGANRASKQAKRNLRPVWRADKARYE